ncbi:vacuolar protein sorting-associated protein 8 homolog [Watersipora subatra]|uniref:vacuolar protein sorting-associated protein 8 homolog n=1 Tax=Watersipora subatra TaxID=2589382 RepID=UPI00355B18CF
MDEKGEVDNVSSAELLLNGLESELEQLDAEEFDLPTVAAPTLESILNESGDEEENDALSSSEESEFGRLLGPFDTASILSFDDFDRKRKRKIYEGHGSVMRHTILKGISTQIVAAQTRINAGFPTAMAIDVLIAIGTAHGIVYVFEPSQAMKWSLGTAKTGEQYGSVSCLSFNVDSSRLLAGHAKGQITMWDLSNGKLLRTITDAHPAGQAVIHIKFTDSFVVAVCADSHGSVFDLEFTRTVTGRGCVSRCLFSGSRGEVCAIEPLHIPKQAKNSHNAHTMLVAMVTFTKLLVINLRPKVSIIYSFILTGQQDCLPLLCWRCAGVKVSGSDAVFEPVLAIARQSTIHFFQAVIKGSQEIEIRRLQTSEVAYKIIAFCWLNSFTLAVMDTFEKIHLVDVASWEELEVIDMSDMRFVYGTSFFKGLATGCNVSPALSHAGGHACYYSLASFRSQLFVLGSKSIHVMTTRTWQERLDVLLRENRHQDAIALALTFYDGTAKAVIGLSSNPEKRQKVVANKMLDILYTYIDLSMTKLCPEFGNIDELIKHYENVVPICVEYCLRLERVDVLFGRLYERFSQDVIAHGAFLECLEPYILDDQLQRISPQIMKDLTSHFQGKDMLGRVEACIIHLDIISLDIHETVKLCWENGMYDAIIYIYNQGLQDYISPLLELIAVLREAIASGKQLSDIHVKLGNKLLVYISNSLAGLAYPLGSLDEAVAKDVKKSIFKTLTCLHTDSPSSGEKAYPHMRTFLDFDTREFLNVMALAFEEPEFGGADSAGQRQRVVDILLQIVVEGSGYTPTQHGMLFLFLARQLARHCTTLHLSRNLFDQIIEFLCKRGDDSHKEERQEALLELLTVEKELQIDADKILLMAEHANLFRVCEYIFKKHNLHDKILLTYLEDPSRCHQAFSFIELTLNDRQSANIHDKITQVTLSHLKALVECDASQTVSLLTNIVRVDWLKVIRTLDSEERTQYSLLKALLVERDSEMPSLDANLHDIYIERMCKFDSGSVELYLKTTDGYTAGSVYEICQKYHQYDSMSYLLEKMGRIQEAFDMMMKTFKEKIELFLELVTDPRASKNTNNTLILSQQLESLLIKLIGLCQRNGSKLTETQCKALWFPLLDSVMEPHQKLPVDNPHLSLFKDASRQVLNSMMEYIELPAIMSKIVKEFTFGEGRFGDVKDLVLGMIHTYNYEKTLRSTLSNMMHGDLLNQMREQKAMQSKAFVPSRDRCSYCNRQVLSSSVTSQLRVFRCGHLFHDSCLERCGALAQSTDDSLVYACYVCSQQDNSTRTRLSSNLQRMLSARAGSIDTDDPQEELEPRGKHKLNRRRRGPMGTSDISLRLIPPSCIDNNMLDKT